MSKKLVLFSISAVIALGVILGFVMSDPMGSKSQPSSKPTGISPVYTSYGTPVYTDDFDAANDTTALKARGYKPYYRGTGTQGATATWYQGSTAVFNAYNGPATGYVAANYNVVLAVNNIDSWLVLPRLAGGILAGDTLYFWSRSNVGSTYPDSVRVMYSANDSIPEGTWTELGRFKTNTTTGWERRGFRAPTASVNGRFAIRYCVANGGPSGANSDYMGIDALTIERTGGSPPLVDPTRVCNYGTMPLYSAGAFGNCSDNLNDTLFIAGGSSTATASTTVQRYAINSGVFSAGTSLPAAKVGGDLIKCGNALYFISGGSALTTPDATCWKYTPATGWVAIAPIPTPVAGHSCQSWGDSVIFVLSGGWSTYLTTIQTYNVNTNTWSTSTPLPAGTGRRAHATGIFGNKIIIAAGYSGTFRKDVYIGTIGANSSTITWALGPAVPFPASVTGCSRPGGHVANGKFYFITGEVSQTSLVTTMDSIFIMDAATSTWLPTIITGRGAAGTASNYWSCVSSSTLPNGDVKVWITGGALGTAFPGLYVLQPKLCTITGITGNEQIPVKYDLSQNYPNPFNPVTKISYSIPQSGFVTLKIYDVLGKEVATLVNDVKTAGNYIIDFNASYLSSGTYFYKLTAGDFTSVKRMVLVK